MGEPLSGGSVGALHMTIGWTMQSRVEEETAESHRSALTRRLSESYWRLGGVALTFLVGWHSVRLRGGFRLRNVA